MEIVDLGVHGGIVRGELDAVGVVVKYGATDDGHVCALLEVLAVRLGWREERQPECLRYMIFAVKLLAFSQDYLAELLVTSCLGFSQKGCAIPFSQKLISFEIVSALHIYLESRCKPGHHCTGKSAS